MPVVKVTGEGDDKIKKSKSPKKKNKAAKTIHDTKANDNGEPAVKLTPYQGTRRAFGVFTCPQCQHKWGSASTWANMGQECWKCRINVYPRAQWKLKKKRRPRGSETGKEHLKTLCEKCKKIGHSCMWLKVPEDDNDGHHGTKKKEADGNKDRKKMPIEQ